MLKKAQVYIVRGIEWLKDLPNDKWKLSVLSAIPFWAGAVLVGLISVFYAQIFHWAEDAYLFLLEKFGLWMFLISPLFFVLSWYSVRRFAPLASGSGIPQVVASLEIIQSKRSHLISHFLGLPVLIVKIISSAFLTLGGGVIGREGPTIQISASIFKWMYDILPAWWPRISPKNMIMTGAAAGLAAAFNTPLGGLVFAIEELTKSHISNFKNSIFIGVVIAGITAQSFLGSYLYLGYPIVTSINYSMIGLVLLSSMLIGGLAGIYTKLSIKLGNWKWSLNRFKTILYLILVSLFITAMSLFLDHRIAGTGRDIILSTLFGSEKYVEWFQPLGKFLGSLFSFTTGASGGVFAPSLSIGASFSAYFSSILELNSDNTNLLIMTGMVAFLTGITRSPFTSAILVLEMTDRHNLIFFFMLAALMGNIASRRIHRKSLYDSIRENLLNRL